MGRFRYLVLCSWFRQKMTCMVAVNRELIEVYRDIGKTIHEQQETAEWGSSVVEQLAKDLKNPLQE